MKLLDSLYQVDHRMLLWCMQNRFQQPLTAAAKVISRSGDGYLQILLPLALYAADPINGPGFFLAVAIAFAIERPLYWLLKNSFQRRRPPDIIPSFKSLVKASDKFSFPSGHTAAAFLLATMTFFFYGSMAMPLFLWAGAVGVSRVLLGVHFPTDILAGAVLGTSIATVCFYHIV